MEATVLYDASYSVKLAYTDTCVGLFSFAHIRYVEPEMCVNPNEADIGAFSSGVFAEPSANVGKVTIMHINSASAIHSTFFFIRTSRNVFGLPQI